ncbi:phosphatase PAP2 family protein [Dactylosporangium darangshiense]|uniref:phosphatase PAP2 family protein n=1 Tax=Dactylosporangium darangshiense TaxID=579108 RepID=UPI003626F831
MAHRARSLAPVGGGSGGGRLPGRLALLRQQRTRPAAGLRGHHRQQHRPRAPRDPRAQHAQRHLDRLAHGRHDRDRLHRPGPPPRRPGGRRRPAHRRRERDDPGVQGPHLPPGPGRGPERAAAGNSLPSGHTTIAASVAVALVMVVPAKARGAAALIGAVFAALAGVATLSAGWHRPSDAVAALLIVGTWAAVAGLFIVLAQRRHGGVSYGPASTYTTVFLTLVSLGLLLGAALCLRLTDEVITRAVDDLSRRRLFVAYAGGALGIAGTTGLMIAAVLSSVHRVVPHLIPVEDSPPGRPSPPPAPFSSDAPASDARRSPAPHPTTRRTVSDEPMTVPLHANDPNSRAPDLGDATTIDLSADHAETHRLNLGESSTVDLRSGDSPGTTGSGGGDSTTHVIRPT